MKKYLKFFTILLMLSIPTICFGARAQYMPDIVVTEPGAAWTDIRSYTSITAAITDIGATQSTLLISEDETLIASVIVPANVTLRFTQGSVITLGAFDLTIVGPFNAGRTQVFNENSTGVVSFVGSVAVPVVFPEWWGAVADDSTDCAAAIQSAVDSLPQVSLSSWDSGSGGKVSFGTGVYKITVDIDIVEGILLEGQGKLATVIQASGANIDHMLYFNGSDGEFEMGGVRDMTVANYSDSNQFPNIQISSFGACGTDTIKERGPIIDNVILLYGGIEIYDAMYLTIRDIFISEPYVGIYITGQTDTGDGCASIGINIDQCEIYGARSYGMHFVKFNDVCRISNSTVWYSEDIPILFENAGTYHSWILFDHVDVNIIPGVEYGWKVEGPIRLRLTSCHVEPSSTNVPDYGFYLENITRGVFSSCYVQNVEYGYFLKNSDYNTFYGCTAFGTDTAGFYLTVTDAATYFSNSFQSCNVIRYGELGAYGFQIDETSGDFKRTYFDSCWGGTDTNGYGFDTSSDSEATLVACNDEQDGNTINVYPIRARFILNANTPHTVIYSEYGSNFLNSDGAVEFDLPADPTGLVYTFTVYNASNLHVDPNGTDQIIYAGCVAGDRVLSSTVGDSITLEGINSSTWMVTSLSAGDGDFTDTVWTDAN